MSVGRIASRYAKSLIDLSVERKNIDTIRDDMATFKSAFQNRGFKLLLKSPIVDGPKKKKIVDAIFKDKIDELSLLFLKSVIDHGREPYFDSIVESFILQYREKKGISTVKLTTATELSQDTVDAIVAKLNGSARTKKKISLTTEVNKGLIGGFIVEFGDKRYDASVANKLFELRKEFDVNLYEKRF